MSNYLLRNMLALLLIVFALDTLYAQELNNKTQKPHCTFTPSFSYLPLNPVAFQKVTFTDNTPGAVQWRWYINNQLVSINPVFTYQIHSGGFFVTLYVSNGTCEDQTSESFNVMEVCNRQSFQTRFSTSG